jgi:hypothetical protein
MKALGNVCLLGIAMTISAQVFAGTIADTGNPNNQMAVASRPDAAGLFEIEAADDFIVNTGGGAVITNGTFTGLLTGSVAIPTVQNIIIEIYRVFPLDSNTVRLPNVPTRANSPSDVAFLTEDASLLDFAFSTATLAASFTANNSVQAGGIHAAPGQTTGGNGPVTGQETSFSFNFAVPFFLPDGHYFFVPQVQVSGGSFYWLSAERPIVTGVPTVPDLQAWTRDEMLDPDWLRVGTDIVGGGIPPTFNMAFSLAGTAVPEPSTLGFCLAALGALGWRTRKK